MGTDRRPPPARADHSPGPSSPASCMLWSVTGKGHELLRRGQILENGQERSCRRRYHSTWDGSQQDFRLCKLGLFSSINDVTHHSKFAASTKL